VTGFLFPFHHFLPSHGVGKVTQLLVLALFVVLAIVAAIRFRNEQLRAA
jgi:hypothetical protein